MPDFDPTTSSEEEDDALADDATDDVSDDTTDDDDVALPTESILVRLERALPKSVLSYLFADATTETLRKVFDKHGLTAEDREDANYVAMRVFADEIKLDAFPDALWSNLPWPDDQEDRARALAADMIGYLFLPAAAHFGDVESVLKSLGGNVADYPATQIETRKLSYAQGAAEVTDRFPGLGGDARRRLAYIVESRLRNVRDDVETKDMLVRSLKTGGLELPAATADQVVAAIRSLSRMTRYYETAALPAVAPVVASAPTEAEIRDVAPVPAAAIDAAEVKRRYAGTEEERAAIRQRITKFRDATKSETEAMRSALFQLLFPTDGRPTDPLYIVAALLAIAEDGELSDALVYDERFQDMVRGMIVGEAEAPDEDARTLIADFEANPTGKKYVNLFLQLVLRGYAVFTEGESARFGLRIANVAAKNNDTAFAGLAAFDAAKGDFAWNDLVPLGT